MIPPLTKVNRILIIVIGVLFLLQTILSRFFSPLLFLEFIPTDFLHGHLYQLITYPFISQGLTEALFGPLLIWFIGGELEQRLGVRGYLMLLLSSVVASAALYLLIAAIFMGINSAPPLFGVWSMTNGLLISYAICYPDRPLTFMLLFPIKAKYFCLILFAITIYMGFFTPSFSQAWGHLGALLGAPLYLISRGWIKKGVKRIKTPSHLKVVQGGLQNPLESPKEEKKGFDPRFFQ